MTRRALLFPGQGAQFVGMGKDLFRSSAVAQGVFAEADEALGMALSELCFEGPAEALNRTEMAQPALLTHSVAVLRAVEDVTGPIPAVVLAGHSLGEWTALVAAGALSLGQAVVLVRLRGKLMQQAVPEGVGAMSAILGLQSDDVERLCVQAAADTDAVVVPATFNGSGNIVVSGHAAAVARAGDLAKEHGAAAVKALAVTAPFHSPLMSPVVEPLRRALAQVSLTSPKTPVRSTTIDGYLETPEMIRAALIEQLTAPVRWEQCLKALVADGVEEARVVGAGRQMTRMVKRMRIGLKPSWLHALPEGSA